MLCWLMYVCVQKKGIRTELEKNHFDADSCKVPVRAGYSARQMCF